MKAGARALGIAESYTGDRSTVAGTLVRASRVVDDFAFATCTVGGLDATDAVCRLWDRLDRADVRVVLIAGIAPAWYNVLDLHRIADHVARPVLSVSFEASEGLSSAISDAFDGEPRDRRLAIYDAQPDRQSVEVNDETIFVRCIDIEDSAAADVIRTLTPAGGRPEPLRVAKQAARAADTVWGGSPPDG